MKKTTLRHMTMAGLFGAIAFVLMYFSAGIDFISPFAKFDLCALPELIGGYVLGPVGAVYIIIIKLLLKLLFQGTTSMFTGEIQNLILSLCYVLPAILYYRKHRTKKGAIIGLAIGSILSIIIAVITNLYLIFPAYIKLSSDMTWDSIIALCGAANPLITNIPTFVAFSIIPFNVISRVSTSIIAVLVYKKISVPLKKMLQDHEQFPTHAKNNSSVVE